MHSGLSLGLGHERDDAVNENPLVPLVEDKSEAASGVDMVHKHDEPRQHRELRPDVRRLAIQQVDVADRLRNDRVETVRAHVVLVCPGASQTSSAHSARQPLCVNQRDTD